MSEPTTRAETPPSLEQGLNDIMCNARKGILNGYQKCENQIRQSPTTTVLAAVAVGYILHRLPLRAILLAKVRLITALTPPAMLILGGAKLYDFLQRQKLK